MDQSNKPAPRGSYTLITGVAGFIGSHLAERLLARNARVLGIDNFDGFYPRSLKEANLAQVEATAHRLGAEFRFLEQDICALPENAWENCEISAVIHLAAKAGVRTSLSHPEEYGRVNVGGTLRMLEFCRSRRIRQMIFASSSSVYGQCARAPLREDDSADRPLSPYGATKRAGELFCASYAHLYGVTIAALRFFTVYGPRQRPDMAIRRFCELIRNSSPVTLFQAGESIRDYTYVDDIVDGILAALDWCGRVSPSTYEVFNLGSSREVELNEVIRLLEAGIGSKAKVIHAPAQAGDMGYTLADIRKSAQWLGYAPKTPLARGIGHFLDWLKGNESARQSLVS